MVMKICERCQQRYSHNKYDIDYIHKCSSKSEVLNIELRRKVGDYEDEATGETVRIPNANLQGSENRLMFTRAGIEGARFSTLIVSRDEARPQTTHRSRQHYSYKEFGRNC